eukprot:COSAG02_NODE_2176_length_9589_cov_4.787671_7_plen_161_part_00
MGCGCAGVERAALTIAAAGAGAKILGPQGRDAVMCSGTALTLQGLTIECRGGEYDSAVQCLSKGRAELSGCTLTSPEGTGLFVGEGATATMDGGSISGCGGTGVVCGGSGSTATVRPPAAAPSAAPPCPLRAAGAAAFFSPVSPFFAAVFWPIGTAVTKR